MFHEDGTMRKSCKSDLVKQFENEASPVKVSALFFTFVDSRQQRIMYFSGSMHACRNMHETRRVGLHIKGVSHSFVQMVYYCLDLFQKASFPLDKHPVASMIFGAIWALKKT
jgi:hypothetical protein